MTNADDDDDLLTAGARGKVKRLRDWSLRSKLLATSFLLVVGVTVLVLIVLVFNVRKLRDHAIPEQRVILSLNSLAFDYLSEIREYLLESEAGTLEELAEIEAQLAALADRYRDLARDEKPRQEASAEAIHERLERLIDGGHAIVRLEDRILETLEEIEAAEEDLVDFGGSVPLALVTRSYEFLSEVRQYLGDPEEQTLEELAEIEAELTALYPEARDAPARIAGLVETGRVAIRQRQALDELLESIETVEQELGAELKAAIAAVGTEVAATSRELLLSVFATGLVGLALAAVLAHALATRVSRPLDALQAASRRFAAGELDVRAPVAAADEVGRLGESFNQLATEIERLICELRQAKAFNESIISSVPAGLVTLDREGRITSANPVFRERWGEDEPIGSRIARRISSPDLEQAVATVLALGADVHGLEIAHQSGTPGVAPAIFRVSVVGLRSADAPAAASRAQALVIFEDVTESRRLLGELGQKLEDLSNTQTQLVHSGKMAAVGELAAGVAHELNNPLSVVLTYSVLLQEKLARASEHTREQLAGFAERLDLIKSSSERCKTIVDNLLVFSRQDDTEISRVDPADLLARTFDLIGSQLRRSQIRVHLEVEEGLPPMCGNFSQLQQVITNLAINAQQAMESGGELTVAVRRAGAECELTVADTGPGIPRDRRARIFEPFFTTKPGGQGTGLGLAIVYGIIQRHRGEIAVDSVVGEGTTFRIRLPFADRQETTT
ncbi:MAG: HAMP domain-containing protein [bacterium]|nr:HAMP domain-containing protein [bacterium]